MSIVKRFVAGAVCPRCAEMDCIRVYRNDIREYRECVRCDYKDGQNLDGTPDPVSEIATRVNKSVADTRITPKDTRVQTVKFVSNVPNSKTEGNT